MRRGATGAVRATGTYRLYFVCPQVPCAPLVRLVCNCISCAQTSTLSFVISVCVCVRLYRAGARPLPTLLYSFRSLGLYDNEQIITVHHLLGLHQANKGLAAVTSDYKPVPCAGGQIGVADPAVITHDGHT